MICCNTDTHNGYSGKLAEVLELMDCICPELLCYDDEEE